MTDGGTLILPSRASTSLLHRSILGSNDGAVEASPNPFHPIGGGIPIGIPGIPIMGIPYIDIGLNIML
jgi:hypothetical protein